MRQREDNLTWEPLAWRSCTPFRIEEALDQSKRNCSHFSMRHGVEHREQHFHSRLAATILLPLRT